MPWLPDYSAARPGAAAVKAAGGIGAMRYTGSLDKISPAYRGDGVVITADEVADFNTHSLPYGLVLEYEATWILRGYQSGHDLAVGARAYEASIGIPPGVTYGAVDFDIQPSQYTPALQTLRGLADGYGGWQYVGAYGSSQFCDWVAANSPITRFWSTDAWSGGYVSPHSALHQRATWPAGVPVVQGCDYNDVLGDWAPRNASTDWFDMATKQDLADVVTAALNAGTAPGQQNWASTNKALLATCQSLVNYCKALTASQNVIIAGGGVHKGLDQIATMVEGVSTGTVDPTALATAVATEVKTITWKAS